MAGEIMFRELGRSHFFNTNFKSAQVTYDGCDYEPGLEDWVVASIDMPAVFRYFSLQEFLDEYAPRLEREYDRLCAKALQDHCAQEVE